MAISNNYVPVKQLGNGATVNYGAAWPIFAAAYIRVYLESVATGVQVLQVLGTDYTLTFDDNGFVVTFLVAPTAANYIVIGRSIELDQTNPYKTSKGFDGSKIEGSYDKLTGMVQDLDNARQRSLVFPLGDTTSTQLPTAAARALGFLGFDALGVPTIYAGVAGIAVSSAMVPVVQAVTLALARTALGLGTAAVQNIGTAGANVPLLSTANTWTLPQIIVTQAEGTNNTTEASTAYADRAAASAASTKINTTVFSVVNSATLVNITGLTWTLVPGSYVLDFGAVISCSSAGGFKFGLLATGAGSGTGKLFMFHAVDGAAFVNAPASANPFVPYGTTGVTAPQLLGRMAFVVTGGNITLTMQFAQAASNATPSAIGDGQFTATVHKV
jgi:hypothetical protein